MKLARLLGITMSLLTHEKISAKEFANKYEVSTRTILRDMDELSAAGIPIMATQGNTGGFSILETFKLERNFLTTEEMVILRSVLAGFKDSVIDEESSMILNKLGSIHSEQEKSPIAMDFSGWADPIHLKHMVERLKKGVDQKQVMEILYYNNNGYETRRCIHPYQLLLKNSAWYVHGFCEKAQDFRIFKLARIKVIKEVERYFERLEVETPQGEAFLGAGQGSEAMVLKFKKQAFSRLFDFFGRESMEFLDNGDIIVRVTMPIDEWVYYVLFGFSTFVEVIEPEHLRDGMLARINQMQEVYSEKEQR